MSSYSATLAHGQIPVDPLAGTPLDDGKWQGTAQPGVNYADPSLMPPDQQYQMLVAYIQAADTANPAPDTSTPPRPDLGEGVADPAEILSEIVVLDSYAPPADLSGQARGGFDGDPHERINDPAPLTYPRVDWYNDDQYFGLGVPPGVENLDQPIETGHSQITLPNPAAEQGWDAWSGRPQLARVARMENSNPYYSAGTNRGHGVVVEKLEVPLVYQTQQYRDLLLAELKKRGVHGVVVADVPSVPYTEQVLQVDPSVLVSEPVIGPEGVLPW